MRIGELSAQSGASVRSLRHYEDCELIVSTRSAAGQRMFDPSMVERVILVRRLLTSGLTTRAIADVLPCLSDPSRQTEKLTHRLIEERDRLTHEIHTRTAMRDALDAVIDAAPRVSHTQPAETSTAPSLSPPV